MSASCKSCRCWVAPAGEGDGICRLNPPHPQVMIQPPAFAGGRPAIATAMVEVTTPGTYWCAQHSEKPNGKGSAPPRNYESHLLV